MRFEIDLFDIAVGLGILLAVTGIGLFSPALLLAVFGLALAAGGFFAATASVRAALLARLRRGPTQPPAPPGPPMTEV